MRSSSKAVQANGCTTEQDKGDALLNTGFTRLGYDKSGTLCVLDVTYPDGSRKEINQPGNSHARLTKRDAHLDLNVSAFPASGPNSHSYSGAFARLGYDKRGVMVVLECGNYRRKED